MLNQRLEQKLQQKLSPQQIQVIRLIESTTLELEERVKQELEDNPALEENFERDDELADSDEGANLQQDIDNLPNDELADYRNEDDIPPSKLEASSRSAGEKKEDIPFSAGITFHESLIEQISLRDLSKNQTTIAEYIIGNIDDEGYLRRDLQAIANDLLFQMSLSISADELENVLAVIQDLEPLGVGARSLQECLLIQLRKQENSPVTELAINIIENQFNELAARHYDKIARELNLSEQLLKNVIQKITQLNPKPGNAFSTPLENRKETIIPDFIVEFLDGKLYISLNDKNMPELRVNQEYAEMLNEYAVQTKRNNQHKKAAADFLRLNIDKAKWFIDALKQRQHTLISTMNAIVEKQQIFFKEGDESVLKPMIMKDIAQKTGFDISTISRVSNSKYVQTNFGIYPLKFFFSESMQTEDGEEISSREIKRIITICIQNEDKNKPLTDDQLTEILQKKSYLIARRTVAKYREQLNIPPSRLRKEI
ncbi:MAG: RNA polymerase factor sigma-54 [Bacteroidales bacterium]|jgi:RNA polymerase sigma-54 factor|nr:RNA polymerase factor sigma-54 [Bacteroidales bacterium]